MHRRPRLAALAALVTLAFVVAGCGGDDGDDDTAKTTTTTEAGETTTAPEAEDADVDCAAYTTVVDLFAGAEEIATGSSDGQVAADESLADALDALAPSAEGDDLVTEALDTLGQVSFQVTDEAEGPSSDEVDAALVTIDDAWGSKCAESGETTETTAPSEEGASDTVPECPAPEVLEQEGFTCDSEGHLTPVDEETVGECPAPEVLEAEGYTCDSEGNLTPVEGGPAEEQPSEGSETTVPAEEPDTTVP